LPHPVDTATGGPSSQLALGQMDVGIKVLQYSSVAETRPTFSAVSIGVDSTRRRLFIAGSPARHAAATRVQTLLYFVGQNNAGVVVAEAAASANHM